MKNKREGILGKVKSIVSALCGIVIWLTRLSSPMQAAKPKALPAYYQYLQLGLGSLICSTSEQLNHGASIVHSYMISLSPPPLSLPSSSSSSSSLFKSLPAHPSSSSSWSSTMGDLIGTESGVYVSSHEDALPGELQKTKPYSKSNQNQRCEMKREYPPPIGLLAQTGNLQGRMPWVFNRHYVNGRLILGEERVRNYEYFEAKKENGRFTLNLIPVAENHDEDVELEDPSCISEDQELLADFYQITCYDGDQDSNVRHWKRNEEVDHMVERESRITLASSRSESCLNSKDWKQKKRELCKSASLMRIGKILETYSEIHSTDRFQSARTPNQFQVILLLFRQFLLKLTMADGHETDKNIEIWKIKKLIKALEAARGNGTSMISLIMPPRDQISRVTKMLGDEFGTASNIKSRVNRQSVLGAITSAQQRLKLYNKVPPNGLVLYTGTIVTDDGKEKKVTIDFEPFRPINASLYLCDNKFHTEALNELLESDDKFGFIVMDGNGTLFGTLSGNTREVLHKFTVDLPKKHGRGGQSALRFARLRMEKRHNYVRKTAELATQFFINPATSQPNVSGLILAGSADFKTELSQSDMFDPRLQAKILNVVDVSYGGENGFNQAIELSSEILSNVKFIQEKKLIGKYFEEISQDTGKYVFGVDDTLKALEMGAVETLIVWENLDINRYVLKNSSTGEIVIKHLNKEQEADQNNFRDPDTSAELEVQEKGSLLEWFANDYKRFGCTLEFVTNKSQEGSQFCRGFGGIGGILRYQLDMRSFDELSDGENYDDSE
ncbi:hypothetical protein F0562_013118 [Nyssa sinensis]|uniref:eRF1/Pelota-like N-terminal domain-containing protein n=1 Tax=Nyssa sinensis TaxID=561372 RepID=A0A5J4ZZJ5_9ASTE|nr:hypothetical protein F0562_013118 [Nyssa sinensis]